ncbi:LrgA family protein [Vallitalea longa]|uniref:LrgA family protein n=1 Tax=Vallitalea longa TaxID=2936439 RepID=A0A9W6DEI0_9FIRM|nr:CidA/LrgA family protein [Vallitalea longa]GKX27604.1 LrgA family protein [Vallitalea longa]
MKLLRQFGIIIGIFLIGELLNKICHVPIPGNILGMVILFVLLSLNVIKVEAIKEISDFLLNHLAFFFIPPGVALISSLDTLSSIWLSFLFITILTTAIVMSVTGLTVQKVMKRGKK